MVMTMKRRKWVFYWDKEWRLDKSWGCFEGNRGIIEGEETLFTKSKGAEVVMGIGDDNVWELASWVLNETVWTVELMVQGRTGVVGSGFGISTWTAWAKIKTEWGKGISFWTATPQGGWATVMQILLWSAAPHVCFSRSPLFLFLSTPIFTTSLRFIPSMSAVPSE